MHESASNGICVRALGLNDPRVLATRGPRYQSEQPRYQSEQPRYGSELVPVNGLDMPPNASSAHTGHSDVAQQIRWTKGRFPIVHEGFLDKSHLRHQPDYVLS